MLDLKAYINTHHNVVVSDEPPFHYSYGQIFSIKVPRIIHGYLKVIQWHCEHDNGEKLTLGEIVNKFMILYMNNQLCGDIDFIKSPREEVQYMWYEKPVCIRTTPNSIKEMWNEISEIFVVDYDLYKKADISKARDKLVVSVIDYIFCNGPDPSEFILS